MTHKPQGLPRELRLRSPQAFSRIFAARVSFRDGLVIAYVQPNGLTVSRVGTAVSKKGRGAPVRNRVRRLLREAFRLERPGLPAGYDWVLLVPKHVRDLDLEKTRRSLRKLAGKIARKLPLEDPSSGAGDRAAGA